MYVHTYTRKQSHWWFTVSQSAGCTLNSEGVSLSVNKTANKPAVQEALSIKSRDRICRAKSRYLRPVSPRNTIRSSSKFEKGNAMFKLKMERNETVFALKIQRLDKG